MHVFKSFIIISLLVFSSSSMARSRKKHKAQVSKVQGRTTAYSICSRTINDEVSIPAKNLNGTQTIIVAVETLSESQCKKRGRNKAEQYATAGWHCVGKNNEELSSCEKEKASSFANFQGIKLDNLTFTNLQKHRSLVAYLNPNSIELCHEDQDELRLAGVTDATCHKRQ